MLIPSIDLQGGRIVQLVQGETLAVESDDIAGWVDRFRGFRRVQLIDLDAAKGEGANHDLVRRICKELPCRVGGGIRSIEAAKQVLGLGATHVILGSALFTNDGVDLNFAARLTESIGPDRLIAAVDSRGGRVTIHGWRTTLDITPMEAVRALSPYVSEFLYTHVDREGLMQGTDLSAIIAVRNATIRSLSAAGGITTLNEVEQLHALGIDSVVGMALYTGKMAVSPLTANSQ
jgi:phosphoribosylformimino-5-aminoimidazole carboxamide ribotide isomerase